MTTEIMMWLVSTLLPVIVGAVVTWVGLSTKIAEMRRDILHLEQREVAVEVLIKDKADKEIVNEMRRDIADIKRILMTHFSEAAKKNNGDS